MGIRKGNRIPEIDYVILKLMRSNQGFTIIELLTAVAILTILTMVGIAQFERYLSRAHQSEAKTALSAMFTSEKSFWIEQNSFTGCLAQAGYAPDGSVWYYTKGFSSGAAATAACGGSQGQACNIYQFTTLALCNSADITFNSPVSAADIGYSANIVNHPPDCNTNNYGTSNLTSSQISANAFVMQAIGCLSTSGTADSWLIDQNKILTNNAMNL